MDKLAWLMARFTLRPARRPLPVPANAEVQAARRVAGAIFKDTTPRERLGLGRLNSDQNYRTAHSAENAVGLELLDDSLQPGRRSVLEMKDTQSSVPFIHIYI